MKLSEAIRKGADLHMQGYGDFVKTIEGVNFTCALGAAYEGITGTLPPSIDDDGDEVVRDTIFAACQLDISDTCFYPVEGKVLITDEEDARLDNVITHLNDQEQWSRAEIAGWLAEQGL